MHPIWYLNVLFGVLLQILIFWRAVRKALWRQYPLFYTYLLYTAFWSLIGSLPPVIRHPAYAQIYWFSYLIAAFLRLAITAEAHRHIFPAGSPLRNRLNIIVLLSLTLLGFLFWSSNVPVGASLLLDSARKLAISAAVWCFILLGLAHYYGVRMGRNIWGMLIGLVTFLGSEFFHLAAMDLLPSSRVVLGYIHPLAFVAMLMVWTFALWDYYPNPRPALDESVSHRLLSAWHDRWAAIPHVLRKAVKP